MGAAHERFSEAGDAEPGRVDHDFFLEGCQSVVTAAVSCAVAGVEGAVSGDREEPTSGGGSSFGGEVST